MSELAEKLRADLDAAEQELSALKVRKRRLMWQIDYIKTLLASSSKVPKFEGKTIAEVAAVILAEEGKPMSAMEIAKRAIAGGWQAESVERARSHFSAIISKDLTNAKARFWQVERGSIGLAEWKKPISMPLPTFAEERPFEEAPFKDDDIPF